MTRLQARSLLVVVLLAISAGLVMLSRSDRLALFTGVLEIPFNALQRGLTSATDSLVSLAPPDQSIETLQAQNDALRARVEELEARVVELEEKEADLEILQALFDYARSEPEPRYAVANVIGRDTSPFLSYVLVDVGSDAGVRRDMPVVTNQGLVGQVVEVNCCAAKVQLVTDPNSAVNARLQSTRDEGVAVGVLPGGIELQFLSQQAEVNPGDRVLTSGLGGTFPEGIVIGTVAAVQRLDYEVLQKATLTPGVDFSRLEVVLIITNFQPVNLEPFLQATEPAPAP